MRFKCWTILVTFAGPLDDVSFSYHVQAEIGFIRLR